METELRCPVCQDFFRDPVMLQCTHHVCIAHAANVQPRERIACPACSEYTVVPDGGLRISNTLQTLVDLWQEQHQQSEPRGARTRCGMCEEEWATKRCIQCHGYLCDECAQTSHSRGFFKDHSVVDVSSGVAAAPVGAEFASRILCDEHPEEKLSFYCLDCRRSVCSHCLLLGEHKGHQGTPIDEAFETGKETLTAWVDKLSQRIQSTADTLEHLRTQEIEVSRGAEAQRAAINTEMDHLRELIETKRNQLLSKSNLEEKQKSSQLEAKVRKTSDAAREASTLVERSRNLLSTPSEHAFLAVVLPLIQDIRKVAGQTVDGTPTVSTVFRPLHTDIQVKSLGDLDLGPPRQSQPVLQPALRSPVVPQVYSPDAPQMSNFIMPSAAVPGYTMSNASAATVQHVGPQAVPVSQVQYVYQRVPTQCPVPGE